MNAYECESGIGVFSKSICLVTNDGFNFVVLGVADLLIRDLLIHDLTLASIIARHIRTKNREDRIYVQGDTVEMTMVRKKPRPPQEWTGYSPGPCGLFVT